MSKPSYDDITSASALVEAGRVWESLKPETARPCARLRFGDGACESAVRRLLDGCWFDPESGCALWTGATNGSGYGWLSAGPDGWGAHRLAWFLFGSDIPDGFLVLHKCDLKRCCNPAHLFVGTYADNNYDKIYKGRDRHGRRAKLGPTQVEQIRLRYAARSPVDGNAALAAEFGVCPAQVSRIVHQHRWKYVPTTN